MTIETKEVGETIYVEFPFSLKDAFKECFPSAKWDSGRKKWTVTTRVRKRLESWIEAARETAQAAADAEELALNSEEIEKLNARLNAIKSDIEKSKTEIVSLEEKKARIIEMKVLIESVTKEKAEIITQLNEAKKDAEQAQTDMYEAASEIADIDLCERLASSMRRLMKASKTSANRSEFDSDQSAMRAELKKLHAAGITSAEMSGMISANYNRSDRDAKYFSYDFTFEAYEEA